MTAHELCFLSISQLAEQIKKQVVSPVEVTQAYLDRLQTGLVAVGERGFQSYGRGSLEPT